jgi:hypothetical protein
MSDGKTFKKFLSGERKLERLETSVLKILSKYGDAAIYLEGCSFEVLEKMAILLDTEEHIKKKLDIEKNDSLKLRLMKMLLNISNCRPTCYGNLTKERLLEITSSHDGERLLRKVNLQRLFKKWYPSAFSKCINNYNSSLLNLLGFPTIKEFVFQKQYYTEDSVFIFLAVGVMVGFIIGRS